MASNPSATAFNAELSQKKFERSVACSLHLWPALGLAVQNQWGGPDSEDKRDWFAGAIVDLFPDWTSAKTPSPAPASRQSVAAQDGAGSAEEPDVADVEAVLLQVMLDEFEVNVDDDSSLEVADQIVRLRVDCAKGRFDEVEALERRWRGRKGAQATSLFKKGEDQDNETDWSTDEDDEDDDESEDGNEAEDVAMTDAPALNKEKPPPVTDEDGFTKVTRKRR